jgi:lauroyl/myristoyl acyltransferase
LSKRHAGLIHGPRRFHQVIAHRNIIKDAGRIFFWFPVRWAVTLAPDVCVYLLGGAFGAMDYLFSGRSRTRRMVKNVTRALGEAAAPETIVRKNLQNHCRNVLEFIKYPRITASNMSRCLCFDGINLLEQELKKGKGVLLVTAHFGAKQLLQVGLGHSGHRVNQINYHMSSEELSYVQKNVSQRQRKKIEARIPAVFIPAGSFLRSAYNCLKNNEVLIVAGDGSGIREHMDDSYCPFDFLGKRMLFPVGPASLAERTGAQMIPVFVVRDRTKHRIVFEQPIDPRRTSIQDATGQYVGWLEDYVRKHPSLWEFWEEFDEDCLLANSTESGEKCTG